MSIVVATDAIDIRRSSDADLIGQVLGVDLVRRPPSLARLFGLHVYPHQASDGDCDELGLMGTARLQKQISNRDEISTVSGQPWHLETMAYS